jgi:hypothetical protein
MSEIHHEPPSFPWLHLGDCPVCGDGLCRIRCCTSVDGGQHLFAICDECETIWLQPDTSSKRFHPDSRDPKCPITGRELFGEHSRWANTEDIRGTVWESEVIVELPSAAIDAGNRAELISEETDPAASTRAQLHPTQDPKDAGEDLVDAGEDLASALDVPALTPPSVDHEAPTILEDWSYGQDEPRPGC